MDLGEPRIRELNRKTDDTPLLAWLGSKEDKGWRKTERRRRIS